MNGAELADVVAAAVDLPAYQVREVLRAAQRAVSAELKRGASVSWAGVGRFEVRMKAARAYRNPRTGETIFKNERPKVSFRGSPELLK